MTKLFKGSQPQPERPEASPDPFTIEYILYHRIDYRSLDRRWVVSGDELMVTLLHNELDGWINSPPFIQDFTSPEEHELFWWLKIEELYKLYADRPDTFRMHYSSITGSSLIHLPDWFRSITLDPKQFKAWLKMRGPNKREASYDAARRMKKAMGRR